jgi:hypothetical protein
LLFPNPLNKCSPLGWETKFSTNIKHQVKL